MTVEILGKGSLGRGRCLKVLSVLAFSLVFKHSTEGATFFVAPAHLS